VSPVVGNEERRSKIAVYSTWNLIPLFPNTAYKGCMVKKNKCTDSVTQNNPKAILNNAEVRTRPHQC